MHQRIPISIKDSNIIYISNTKIDNDFQTINHSHPNLEILFIYDGNGIITTKEEKIKLNVNDIVIINPKESHIESSNEGLSFYAIGLSNLSTYSTNLSSKGYIIIKNCSDHIKILSLYKMIFDESLSKNNNYELIIHYLVDTILIYLKREINNISESNNHTFDSNIVSFIKNYCDNNYSKQIKLDDFASLTNSSVSYICNLFKRIVGKSIIEYKINKQLLEANNLIKITDMNVNQIAVFVGFNNQSYFNKLYKLYFNETPKETRLKAGM